MSLYIGKDNNATNILHITKSTQSPDALKNGFIPNSTIFLSSEPLFEVIYEYTMPVPTATYSRYGHSTLPDVLSYYLNNDTYTSFLYVVDSFNNASSAFYSDIFYFKWENEAVSVVNTMPANNGKIIMFIISRQTTNTLNGTVSISKNNIIFDGTSLSGKKFLVFSSDIPNSEAIYRIGGNGFMYVSNSSSVDSFLFLPNKIQYSKSGNIYDFISQDTTSRVHSYYSSNNSGSLITHYNKYGISYDGEICKHIIREISANIFQQISVSFSYPFYYAEGWSGGGDVSNFNINITFSSNASKLLGFSLSPYMGFMIEWNHQTKTLFYGAHRYTDQIELEYAGSRVPIAIVKAI